MDTWNIDENIAMFLEPQELSKGSSDFVGLRSSTSRGKASILFKDDICNEVQLDKNIKK